MGSFGSSIGVSLAIHLVIIVVRKSFDATRALGRIVASAFTL
jgi:hypothetical protein